MRVPPVKLMAILPAASIAMESGGSSSKSTKYFAHVHKPFVSNRATKESPVLVKTTLFPKSMVEKVPSADQTTVPELLTARESCQSAPLPPTRLAHTGLP